MERKEKLRLVQFILLAIGLSVIFFTYYERGISEKAKIISKETQEKINKQLKGQTQTGDVFYNIEYSGLDLEGNRYTLKSEEAINSKSDPKIVDMKVVNATFYFKDDTVLNVFSDTAIYNNQSLDMVFNTNVKALYVGSELFAEKAVFSNSQSFLTISEKVKIKDIRGTMFADELIFDIKKKTLNIASFNNNKIKANVDLK